MTSHAGGLSFEDEAAGLTESAFCFSHHRDDGSEWWFQLSLADVGRVAKGEPVALNARKSE